MTRRTRIKICGLRDGASVDAAVDAGADAVGFVLVPGTPRFVRPEDAYALGAGVGPLVTPVGVVRNLGVEAYCDLEERCPLPLMQLHGDEPEEVVRQCGPGVIKAIRVDPGDDAATLAAVLARWASLEEVDALLVDGPSPGSGAAIDWSVLRAALDEVGPGLPLFLAGGLTPDNVGEAVRTVRPFAVDVSSGVESSPGVKDPSRIAAFCAAVREADATMG